LIPYGSLILLCGRLGDYYGHQRVFFVGTALFTVASLGCGLAGTLGVMVSARAIQGATATAMLVASLSSVLQEFEQPADRARAMAIYSSVQAGASTAGLLLGGLLTHLLSWRWMFLINLPIGIMVCLLYRILRLDTRQPLGSVRLDIPGAATLTASLLLIMSWALNSTPTHWYSAGTWITLCSGLSLFALFVAIEARVQSPLLPLTLLLNRNLRVALGFGALRLSAISIWAIIYALYLQHVLGYNALEIGVAFLPYSSVISICSLGLSARLVLRFGCRPLLCTGAVLLVIGLLFMSRVPVKATYLFDILPPMILLGLGNGMTYSPFLLSGLSTIGKGDYGIASAILNSSALLASTLALAVVAGQATARNDRLATAAMSLPSGQADSYSIALLIAALLAVGAVLVSLYVEERRQPVTAGE